ncbi:mesencephalic astrocyte-derived neurotrophic factor homolog [Anneissia japonica]|uniref:mesencephalic astrocyte-derived neurotrophic factor homolog n=1 Tax=Anneissia japonica TaxID=1529436 RepID=UPI00142589E9|nr:mesencephalic astrocyte-derived neurotrophic factor homolog [Anneissia japonica]
MKTWLSRTLLITVFFAVICKIQAKLQDGDCEVCISVVKQIDKQLTSEERKSQEKIEGVIRKICKKAKNRENRFCYYVGGTEDAATGLLGEISKPLISHMPADRICEKLKKKDGQICELKYEKQIDLDAVDLKKLKVKDLKKILSDWGEVCKACTEKSDFIKLIEKLKPKHFKKQEL